MRPLLWASVALPIAAIALVSAMPAGNQSVEPACNSNACLNLVFDGDSISAGAGASRGHGLANQVADALGANVSLHNVAVGGRPVNECLRLYSHLVAPLFNVATPHNVIVFHAGDNDIVQGRNATETYVALTAYVAAAHQQHWQVVVSTELRRPQFNPSQETELERYNDSLRQNKAGADAVVDFDTEPRMVDLSYRRDPALFSPDGVHPNQNGYAVLAAMLVPAVKRAASR